MNEVLQRAIARIKRGIEMAVKANDEKAVEELKVTLEALEKQVPIDVDEILKQVNDEECVSSCPACNQLYISNFDKYCRHCGQKLDWSGEDE